MPALSFAGPPGAVDEFNIWEPAPRAAPREFDLAGLASAPPAPEVVVWEQELAPAAGPAGAVRVAGDRLDAAAFALPEAEMRAAVFAAADGQVAAVAADRAEPERALAEWVRISQAEPALPAGAAESLASRPDFRQAAEGVGAFFQKVREATRNYALIVSRLDGRPVAVTQVSWTGDFRAAWAEEAPADAPAAHLAAVDLALRTRDLWLRLAATVLRGAFQLAALFAVNPVLALPAAYRFVRQVIEQAQALHATLAAAPA